MASSTTEMKAATPSSQAAVPSVSSTSATAVVSGTIPTIDQMKATWQKFSPFYQQYYEPPITCLGRTMTTTMHMSTASSVLEIGGGSGLLAEELARQFAKSTAPVRYVVTDLSPDQVAMAKTRLSSYTNVEVREADACALPFGNESFDRVFGNMCLMMVPDANIALREAYRVLKPGGIAGFSIWAEDGDTSPWFTLLPRALDKVMGSSESATRSNFHLWREGQAKLKERFVQAGFTANYVVFRQSVVAEVISAENFVENFSMASPSIRAFLTNVDPSRIAEIRATLTKMTEEVLANGRPLSLDCACFVVRKPLTPSS